MRIRALIVVALLAAGGAGCTDTTQPHVPVTSGSAAPAPTAPVTSKPSAGEPTLTGETATAGAGTSAPWTVPDVPGEIARATLSGGNGESMISGAATAGEPLTLRVACRDTASAAEAGYSLVDARVDQERSLGERTFLSGTAQCDGLETVNGFSADFTGPVQVILTIDAVDPVDGYAILSTS